MEKLHNTTRVGSSTLSAEQCLDGLKGLNRFEDVGFPGPAIGVVAASVDVEPDKILALGGRPPAAVLVEEFDFGEVGIAPMQHDVEAPLLGGSLP